MAENLVPENIPPLELWRKEVHKWMKDTEKSAFMAGHPVHSPLVTMDYAEAELKVAADMADKLNKCERMAVLRCHAENGEITVESEETFDPYLTQSYTAAKLLATIQQYGLSEQEQINYKKLLDFLNNLECKVTIEVRQPDKGIEPFKPTILELVLDSREYKDKDTLQDDHTL